MSDSEFEKARDEAGINYAAKKWVIAQRSVCKDGWKAGANWAREWLITNEKPTKYNKDDGRVCTVNPRLVEQVHKIGSDFVEKLALEQENTELKQELADKTAALEFYANDKSWEWGVYHYEMVVADDLHNPNKDNEMSGGKTAQEVLNRWNKK